MELGVGVPLEQARCVAGVSEAQRFLRVSGRLALSQASTPPFRL
jgi:hypothetical protein